MISQHTIQIAIKGMTCASCVARVEKKLLKISGVTHVSVNLVTEQAKVICLSQVTRQMLCDAIESLGFSVDQPSDIFPTSNAGSHASKVKPIQSFFAQTVERMQSATFNQWRAELALMLALPFWIQMFFVLSGELPVHSQMSMRDVWEIGLWPLSPAIQCFFAIVVQCLPGMSFYRTAFHAAKDFTGNMELLVTIGTLSALGLSLYLWLHGEPHLYFEASISVIAFVLLGKSLEQRARFFTRAAIVALQNLRPERVCRVETTTEGQELESFCESGQIRPGHFLRVRAGEAIPADGIITAGTCLVDMHLLTGESMPVPKGVGDSVLAGAINLDGLLTLRVTAASEDSSLARMIATVLDAQMQKPAIQHLVDKVSAVFVPGVIGFAGITLISWLLLGQPLEAAMLAMISVLVIACPCALGLATPVALLVASGEAARQGMLIRNLHALEILDEIRCVIWDKTGTLTTGQAQMIACHAFDGDQKALLNLAAALAQGSQHPMSQAILYARNSDSRCSQAPIPVVQDLKNHAGKGLQARLGKQTLYLGHAGWMTEMGAISSHPDLSFVQKMEADLPQATWVYLAESIDETLPPSIIGMIALADSMRADAALAVKKLAEMGMDSILLSGDAEAAVAAVAGKIGISRFFARKSPADKVSVLQQLTKRYSRAVMVGDGINDAAALAIADVSFAMGNGSDIAMHSADICLLRPMPLLIVKAVELSQRTQRIIRQNLFWALIYNVIGLPLAAFGLLNPVFAGAAMALSSVSVVGNALRIRHRAVDDTQNS